MDASSVFEGLVREEPIGWRTADLLTREACRKACVERFYSEAGGCRFISFGGPEGEKRGCYLHAACDEHQVLPLYDVEAANVTFVQVRVPLERRRLTARAARHVGPRHEGPRRVGLRRVGSRRAAATVPDVPSPELVAPAIVPAPRVTLPVRFDRSVARGDGKQGRPSTAQCRGLQVLGCGELLGGIDPDGWAISK